MVGEGRTTFSTHSEERDEGVLETLQGLLMELADDDESTESEALLGKLCGGKNTETDIN